MNGKLLDVKYSATPVETPAGLVLVLTYTLVYELTTIIEIKVRGGNQAEIICQGELLVDGPAPVPA